MITEEIKKQILAFLGKHTLTVISTVDIGDSKPESAVIAFAENDNLELVFGTSNTTRKYKNLQKNPNVSFVIGWSSDVGTLQYEGTARELSMEESGPCSAAIIAKNPFSKRFAEKDDLRYFLVTPTWIRLLDLTQSIPAPIEVNL